ncbi:MAG: zf-TFIIB domain-containing protein [Candidatus Sericytochromatia bacterium]
MLTCPRCQFALTPHTVTTDVEGWQIEVDVCDQGCHGLWLEAHDAEADAEAKLLLDSELAALNRGGRQVSTLSPIDCPEGHGRLHRFDWNNENVHLDTCETCQGRWIDGGEIAKIQAEWGREPIAEHEILALANQARSQTEANWEEESFGSWLIKRLTFKAMRKKG